MFLQLKRLRAIVIILIIALAAIIGLILLMKSLAISTTAALPSQVQFEPTATPTSTPADEVVATVNGYTISKETWNKTTRLDAVMNELTGQPLPTAEETLDRLVNEIIVLEAITTTGKPTPPSTADIETRVLALEQNWGVTDEALMAALQRGGLTRDDLNMRVGRLIQVEAALNQLTTQYSDLDAWLNQARASAEIGLYYPLATARPAPNQPPIEETPASVSAPPPDMPVSPYQGNAAPDFALAQLNGDPITLSSLRGRPTLVNFWASWCPPCRRELPSLQAAYDRYGDKIGFIAIDVKEDQATVESFVKELNLTFPVALDPDGQVSDLSYQARGIPTTIFVDANGVVAARHVGPLDETTIDNYLTPLLEQAKTEEREETREASSPLPTPTLTANLAPAFSLSAASGRMVSLQDYRDKSSVVLVFYRGQT